MKSAKEIATANSSVARERMKTAYDKKVSGEPYRVGDLVMCENPARKAHGTTKLALSWEGPYLVSEVKSDQIYTLENADVTPEQYLKNGGYDVHYNRLKPYQTRRDSLNPNETLLPHHSIEDDEGSEPEPETSVRRGSRPIRLPQRYRQDD